MVRRQGAPPAERGQVQVHQLHRRMAFTPPPLRPPMPPTADSARFAISSEHLERGGAHSPHAVPAPVPHLGRTRSLEEPVRVCKRCSCMTAPLRHQKLANRRREPRLPRFPPAYHFLQLPLSSIPLSPAALPPNLPPGHSCAFAPPAAEQIAHAMADLSAPEMFSDLQERRTKAQAPAAPAAVDTHRFGGGGFGGGEDEGKG